MPDGAMDDTFTYIEGLCIYSQDEKEALFINKPTPMEKEYSFISELACEEVCVSCRFMRLAHCGLVTPYGDRDLGQHWLR